MGEGVDLRVFNAAAATRVVRVVAPILEGLVRAKHELDEGRRRREVLSVVLSGASDTNRDAGESRDLKQRCDALGQEIGAGIRAIQRHGCVVKDLDRGLLDFYAISGDRLIFLCWQLGEPEVAHWHTLEGGFGARQPLDAADL